MLDSKPYGNVYRRDSRFGWVYAWGEPVPNARDLELSDILALSVLGGATEFRLPGQPPEAVIARLRRDRAVADADDAVLQRWAAQAVRGEPVVVGMHAPELHVNMMLTVDDIADLIGVATSTVHAYRQRGYLPQAQAVVGRTPLWSRAVINRWRQQRPGKGWRSDMYGRSVV